MHSNEMFYWWILAPVKTAIQFSNDIAPNHNSSNSASISCNWLHDSSWSVPVPAIFIPHSSFCYYFSPFVCFLFYSHICMHSYSYINIFGSYFSYFFFSFCFLTIFSFLHHFPLLYSCLIYRVSPCFSFLFAVIICIIVYIHSALCYPFVTCVSFLCYAVIFLFVITAADSRLRSAIWVVINDLISK